MFAHVAVTAVLGKTSHDEVAHAGETGKRFRLRAESLSQAAHFCLTASENGSAGIVTNLELAARFEAVKYAGSNGNDVFDGTAKFHADDISRSIDAEVRATHRPLHNLRRFFVHASSDNGRKHVAAHFFGMRRTAKGNHLVFGQPRDLFENDFAHELVRAFENSLRSADDNRFLALFRSPGAEICSNTTHKLRRHDNQDHIAAVQCGMHVGCIFEICRENNAREFILVLVFRRKQIYFCLRVRPKSQFVLVFVNNLAKRKSPATGT